MIFDFLAERFVFIQSMADVCILLIDNCDMHEMTSLDVELLYKVHLLD